MPFGLIKCDGSQQYYALGGQHRLRTIKDAVEKNVDLGREEIAVIFVAHHESQDRLKRRRRLFTALNRYAVKMATHMNIVMDEDDAVAIVTRQLLREHPLFMNERVKLKGKSIARGEENTLTTLPVLYEMNQNLLMTAERNVRSKAYQQFNPGPDAVEKLYQELSNLWDGIADNIPAFRAVGERKASPRFLREGGDVSDLEEGSLLLRPIGQLAFSRALRAMLNKGTELEESMQCLARVGLRFGHDPIQWTVSLSRLFLGVCSFLIEKDNGCGACGKPRPWRFSIGSTPSSFARRSHAAGLIWPSVECRRRWL